MGQRGQLDRLLVAHTTSVTSLAWRNSPGSDGSQTGDNGLGWFASGSLDRCIKVWDLTSPGSISHIPARPTYILHPRYPVRQILWRPGYDCEIAVVSNPEFAASKSDVSHHLTPPFMSRPPSAHGLAIDNLGHVPESEVQNVPVMENKVPGAETVAGGTIEIWDVRRGWIAKWSVRGSGADGSLTGNVPSFH
jgi:WD40 repeat protein